MLDAIRKHSSSIVVKALMGLLIFSFAIWGIGDVIRGGGPSGEVAKVGGTEISPAAFGSELQREVTQLRTVLGDRFTMEQARGMGIADAVLSRMVNDLLVDLAAKDLGIVISDELVRQRIQATGAFRGVGGGFDRARFQMVLQNIGMSEAQFIARVRSELARAQLVESLDGGVAMAPSVVDALYRLRQERRVADVVTFADAAMPGIGQPDEAAIVQYYQDHAASFTAPEYRTVTVLRLTADEVAKEIAVPDAEIKEAYETHGESFRHPERRRVEQFLVSDEALARKASDRIKAGEDFAAVGKEAAGAAAGQLDFGLVSREQILPELAEAAFSLAPNAVSEPVRSPLGWHVVRVTAIEEARQQPLEEVKGALRAEIARDKAIESLYKISTRLEDALAGGASLDAAAAKLALPIAKLGPLDGQGKDAAGNPVPGLLPRLLETAFGTAKGSDSGLVDMGGEGYFVVRVDDVTAAVLRPLDKVRAEVVAAWTAERRSEAANKAAEALVERLNAGGDLGRLAKEQSLAVNPTAPIRRTADGTAGRPPEALVAQIFAAAAGTAVLARGTDGYLVARVREVIPADPAGQPDGVKALARQLAQSARSDLRAQLAAALRERYPVTVNRRAIDQLF